MAHVSKYSWFHLFHDWGSESEDSNGYVVLVDDTTPHAAMGDLAPDVQRLAVELRDALTGVTLVPNQVSRRFWAGSGMDKIQGEFLAFIVNLWPKTKSV